MLVITRSVNESIVLTYGLQQVRIKISKIRSNQVRLAIDAPMSIDIMREEIALEEPKCKKPLQP